jgi:nucleotide-binding universal stress UspA family protein
MLQISRIVVPVDFSERCAGILSHAQAIASRCDAELTLLHVVNPVYSIPSAGPFGPAVLSLPPSVFEDAGRQLDTFGADQLQQCRVRRLIYEGDPAEQIAALAKSEDIQLIVMPTHGLGMLRRFLIGSVTAKVLHDAACPVLTGVHMEQASPSKAGHFSNILCAVDLGPNSGRTLEWAAQFAETFGARLGIVHAVLSSQRGDERKNIEELQQSAGAKEADVSIVEGEPVKTVITAAKSMAADLLVIGRAVHEDASGRLRPNAYAMISQSLCPVVSV